jgi:uncharacterized protein with GYD domain
MATYMTQFSYTSQAWAALVKNPEDRGEAVGKLLSSMGARLISLHFSFGEYDGLIITEAPDDITVAAAVVAAVSPGHVKAIKTTRLFTSQEGMEIMRKAGGQSYRAPS